VTPQSFRKWILREGSDDGINSATVRFPADNAFPGIYSRRRYAAIARAVRKHPRVHTRGHDIIDDRSPSESGLSPSFSLSLSCVPNFISPTSCAAIPTH